MIRIAAGAVVVVIAWGVVALLIWNLDRGFDLTDEAALLYYYRHPDADLDRLVQNARVVRALLPAALDHIIWYRVVKLAGFVLLSGVFAFATVQWLKQRAGFIRGSMLHPLVFFHFVLIGCCLAYCHGSQMLSYNDLVTFSLLIVAAACFALDLTGPRLDRVPFKFAMAALAGVAIAFLIPSKWPSVPLLAGYFIVFVLTICRDHRRATLAAMLGGAAAGFALVIVGASDLGFGRTILLKDLVAAVLDPVNHDIHPPLVLMRFYVASTLDRVVMLARHPAVLGLVVLPFAVMLARARSRDEPRPRIRPLIAGLIVATAVCLAIVSTEAPGWARGHTEYFQHYNIADIQTFASVAAWIAACLAVRLRDDVPRRDAVAVLGATLLLAALPAIGAAGTNNPPLTQFIRHMALPFAAIAVVTAVVGMVGRWRPFATLVCATLAVLSAAQIAFVVLVFPYRLPERGLDQTISLDEPRHMAGLKVDATTDKFIRELLPIARQAVGGDTTGVPMMALLDVPSVIYLLDGFSIGNVWLTRQSPEAAICQRARRGLASGLRPRLLVLDDRLSSALATCLREAGLDVDAYSAIARIDLPPDPTYTGPRAINLLVPAASDRR